MFIDVTRYSTTMCSHVGVTCKQQTVIVTCLNVQTVRNRCAKQGGSREHSTRIGAGAFHQVPGEGGAGRVRMDMIIPVEGGAGGCIVRSVQEKAKCSIQQYISIM